MWRIRLAFKQLGRIVLADIRSLVTNVTRRISYIGSIIFGVTSAKAVVTLNY